MKRVLLAEWKVMGTGLETYEMHRLFNFDTQIVLLTQQEWKYSTTVLVLLLREGYHHKLYNIITTYGLALGEHYDINHFYV